MNKFTQHIPSFIETDLPPPSFEFETTEQLLNHELVKRYIDDKFSHFAMSGNTLMRISDDGYSWWVVGYIKEPDKVDLPQWDGGKMGTTPEMVAGNSEWDFK